MTQAVTEGLLPSSEAVEEAQAVLISPLPHVDLELQACSPAKNQQVRSKSRLQHTHIHTHTHAHKS